MFKTGISRGLTANITLILLMVFTKININAQCPTTAPITTGACSMGTGSVDLTASGGTGYYNWYDAVTGGTYLGSGATYSTPLLASTTTYYAASAGENYALDFDGNNDRIELGNPSELQITGDMTIEMWIKPDDFDDRYNPYAKAYGGEGTITQETSGTLNFYYGTNGGNAAPYQGFNSSTALVANQWNHAAIVRDLSNMKLYWYINGSLTNTTNASYGSATSGSNDVFIGQGYVRNYDGQIDEVRVWNTARTSSEISNNMNICIDPATTGLAAYFDFNEGSGSTSTDLTTGGNDGSLEQMHSSDWITASYQYHCASCESSRTAAVATINLGTPVDIGEDICTSGSLTLDAGAGYTNYLWSTTETSQTINASATGTYFVEADDGAGCISKDTVNLTFIDTPTGTDGCLFGAGSMTLEASGSTGNYHWYDASTGGNLLGSGSSFTTPYAVSTTNYYVSAFVDNNCLDFDGSSAYVSIGNPAELSITGDMTIEMWIKPDNFSSRKNPYAKAYGGEGTITQEMDGDLSFYYGTNGGNASPYQGFRTNSPLVATQWTHIAVVRDLSNLKLYWYINGELDAQATALYGSATAGILPALIGGGYVDNYDGQIDELRIWSTARTQTEIADNMNNCVDPTSANLNAYYKFEDGTGSNSAYDATSNGNSGSLVSFDVSTDWIVSSNSISCDCESERTTVIAEIADGTPTDLGNDTTFSCGASSFTLDAGPGYANYLWSTAETSQTITVSSPGSYWARVDYGTSCYDIDTISINKASGPSSSITLNGTSNQVDLGNPAELQITGNQTIEMWIKPTNFSSRKNPYAKSYGGEGTITQETSGALSYYYGTNGNDGSPYQGFGSSSSLTAGQWHHVAIVRDLDNMVLYWYINGVQTSTAGASYATAAISTQQAYIGAGYRDNYNGEIDEFRIWNTARSLTEIRESMCSRLDGTETGLVAYYPCDTGTGSTLYDGTLNGIDGTLKNSTGWAESGAYVGDKSTSLYTGSWSGATIKHALCNGESLTVSNMSGSPDGVHIYYVGEAPEVTTGIVGLGTNNRYFGVFKANDAVASYTATYNYEDNPYVSQWSEPDLTLYTRSDNSVATWTEPVFVLDPVLNTISTTATGTEFILGSKGTILPITLVSFEATLNSEKEVELEWITANELNNDFFSVERTIDGNVWEEVLVIDGAGTSNDVLEYLDYDFSPITGVSYYRLKQTDYNGNFSYSDIKMIRNIESLIISNDLIIWPNPSRDDFVNIELSGYTPNSKVTITFRNLIGNIIYQNEILTDYDGYVKDVIQTESSLSAGTYIVTASDNTNISSVRLIKL